MWTINYKNTIPTSISFYVEPNESLKSNCTRTSNKIAVWTISICWKRWVPVRLVWWYFAGKWWNFRQKHRKFVVFFFGRDRRNNRPYALKMMEKYNIIKTRQLAHTGAEIKLMKNLNFPFIIDMHGFFMVYKRNSWNTLLNQNTFRTTHTWGFVWVLLMAATCLRIWGKRKSLRNL